MFAVPFDDIASILDRFPAAARQDGNLAAVMAFTVRDGRVAAIDVLSDPDRLARMDVSSFGP